MAWVEEDILELVVGIEGQLIEQLRHLRQPREHYWVDMRIGAAALASRARHIHRTRAAILVDDNERRRSLMCPRHHLGVPPASVAVAGRAAARHAADPALLQYLKVCRRAPIDNVHRRAVHSMRVRVRPRAQPAEGVEAWPPTLHLERGVRGSGWGWVGDWQMVMVEMVWAEMLVWGMACRTLYME